MFEILDKKELTPKEVSFLLVSFLRKKGLLEDFCEEHCEYNTYKYGGQNNKKCTPKQIINEICNMAQEEDYEISMMIEYADCSFLWETSKKGRAFWRDISEEWKKNLHGKLFREYGR